MKTGAVGLALLIYIGAVKYEHTSPSTINGYTTKTTFFGKNP